MTGRPPLSWADLAGAHVGLYGLGVEGGANLRRLRALGVEPVLVDDRPSGESVDGLPVLATDRGGLAALGRCDVVVKTPGVSRYRPEVESLVAAGIPVTGGLGLWLEGVDRRRVIGVTGTKGKSTTSAIAGHLLERLGHPSMVGGNIGRPPYDPDGDGPADPEFYVIEISSFQATDLASSPHVMAVTSLAPDHLDWHGDVVTYVTDKLSATTQPGASITVADATSPLLAEHADRLGPRVRWVGDEEDGALWADGLGLDGTHNRRNARLARACLQALGIPEADDDDALAAAAVGFHGLESRFRRIGMVEGVEFIDDSLSTNVLPALAALESLAGRRVALLVGGFDRGRTTSLSPGASPVVSPPPSW